jgi:hypothetical protein
VPLGGVERLDSNHVTDGFDCGKPSMNTWLQRHALGNQAARSSTTYVRCNGGFVRAYHSLVVDGVEFKTVPEKIRSGLLGRYPVPVILLARLAVDLRQQGQRIGEFMLVDALRRSLGVSYVVGVKAVMVDALDDQARRFYERYDFEPSPSVPDRLFLLMQDIEATFGASTVP